MRWGSVIAWLGLVACSGTEDVSTPPPGTEPQVGCAMECHGAENSNAPPKSTTGATETTAVAVGAHQAHMNPSPAWHMPVQCSDCHQVPTSVDAPGHIDGDGKAEVIFSPRIIGGGTWTGTTCTTGCHGSPAWGGARTTPTWTQVDGTQSQCGSCHGAPPPPPHPAGANCASCHPTMEENMLVFREPLSHINGKIDLVDPSATGGCANCHGSTNAAPPKDLAGNLAGPKVGAHQAHLRASQWRHAITCANCHVVPLTADTPGHRDGDNVAEVRFDALNPAGTFAGGTCSNLYCHGNGRGNTGTIAFTTAGPLMCGACHSINGTGMSGDHADHIGRGVLCSECHQTVVNAGMQIVNADLHVNGVHEVKMATGTYNAVTRACTNTTCHPTHVW